MYAFFYVVGAVLAGANAAGAVLAPTPAVRFICLIATFVGVVQCLLAVVAEKAQ